jgi:NTE family protein
VTSKLTTAVGPTSAPRRAARRRSGADVFRSGGASTHRPPSRPSRTGGRPRRPRALRDASASAPSAVGRVVQRDFDSPPSSAARPRKRAPRTAFVLAGGASLGALQAGMLRALYERGIRPDLLVGTSAGGLNAAFIASRPQTVQTAKELAQVWRSLQRQDVFPLHPSRLIRGLANHRDHLVSDRALRRLISRHVQLDRLERAEVPLHLVCFDLSCGEEVRISEGPVLDAVLASASIPGVLPPVHWEARVLVDGGVANNTPISHAVELGAERIYVLATEDGDARRDPPPRGAVDLAVHAVTLLLGARLRADLVRYADAAELIVLPAANHLHVQPTDFEQADRLIGAALQAARATLEEVHVQEVAAA